MEYAFAATSVEELCAEIYAARLTAKIHSKINAKMELLRLEIAILQERLNKQAQYRHAFMASQINLQQQMRLHYSLVMKLLREKTVFIFRFDLPLPTNLIKIQVTAIHIRRY